ncbi:DUF3016 domain-containing protein [Ancylobacter sp. Lp-2]|uniref:DUF3016 domain-containing protein n=1 Tax=Ancylobacter sp. Lp-2 TaxID=2881339 RepID=UPI001E443476|nr:DUF3016 domain-containing protein [Ancylobacter sp. Lp-2]MCB4770513.1 DUF3016 domain-containing protein [Ancylobacter sp. Lp-2]
MHPSMLAPMRAPRLSILTLLAALAASSPASATPAGAPPSPATARVNFLAPQGYVDGNLEWSSVDQRLTFEGLSRLFDREARRALPAGTVIEVDILALDLAGKIDPLASRTGELRVMRANTWPSLTLRYRLLRDGRVVGRGEETLRSMNYLMNPRAARSGEPLRYERAMIADWFRARFAGAEG